MAKAVVNENIPNRNQFFVPCDDQWMLTQLPFLASTAISDGAAVAVQIVANTTTGNHTLMGATNALWANFVGILADPIVATDPDFAVAGKLRWVWVPRTNTAECFFARGAGVLTAIDVGKTVAVTAGALGLSVDTQGLGATITQFINANRGKCIFNMPTSLTA